MRIFTAGGKTGALRAVDVHPPAMDVLDVALDGRLLPHEVLAQVWPLALSGNATGTGPP